MDDLISDLSDELESEQENLHGSLSIANSSQVSSDISFDDTERRIKKKPWLNNYFKHSVENGEDLFICKICHHKTKSSCNECASYSIRVETNQEEFEHQELP